MQTQSAASSQMSSFLRRRTANPMSAAEETAAAERLGRLREQRWATLLAYPPIAEEILRVVSEHLGDAVDAEALDAAVQAARTVQEKRRVARRRHYDATVQALAVELARHDRDQVVADMIQADLEAISSGDSKHASISSVPRRTDTFERYVRRCRRAHTAWWAARNEFVTRNLRLVVSMAQRFGRGRLPIEDLIQEGNLGLMKAVDRFDPSRGFRFSTYGVWWIRHAINRAVQNKGRSVRLPVHVLESIQRLAEARRLIEAETGAPADLQQLAAKTEIPLHKIERLEHCIVVDSPSLIEDEASGSSSTSTTVLADLDQPSPAQLLLEGQLAERIREHIDALPEMERDIVRRRFGLDGSDSITLRELGETYHLSRERIRQIQERAIASVRARLERDGLV